MYRRRNVRRRQIAYVPRPVSSQWSHETTNISIRVTNTTPNASFFPINQDGTAGDIVIPALTAQGVRFVKNIRLKITVYGTPIPCNCMLIYCPFNIDPAGISSQDGASLYEPNQNLITHILYPQTCNYDADPPTAKIEYYNPTLISYSKATWRLNSDDCVRLIVSQVAGSFNSASFPTVVIGTVDYWIKF